MIYTDPTPAEDAIITSLVKEAISHKIVKTIIHNGEQNDNHIRSYIMQSLDKCTNDLALLKWIARYISWNGHYGGYMATLSGKVANARSFFISESDKKLTRDRSCKIASYVFATAADEFMGPEGNEHTTHRCLAQNFLYSMSQHLHIDLDEVTDVEDVNFKNHIKALSNGFKSTNHYNDSDLLEGMGFHMASEHLGDIEYTEIDRWLRLKRPQLVEKMGRDYLWIKIHSSLGGGVEAEHFEEVKEGVVLALNYCILNQEKAGKHLANGYCEYEKAHEDFFLDRSSRSILQVLEDGMLYRHNIAAWWRRHH
jgi:hypothetical protein